MPMGDYKDFDACVAANQDKKDPKAYCGEIKAKVEKTAQGGSIPIPGHKLLTRLGKMWKMSKTGVASMPADQNKSIDTDLHAYQPKFGKRALAKAWGAMRKAEDQAEYEKERKEHPDLSDEIIHQIVADHARERMEKACSRLEKAREVEHGHEPKEIEIKHSIGAKDFAIIEACFLKPGEYHDNAGVPHRYDADVIKRDKDSFKGQKFYLDHKEGVGYEYGLITDVKDQLIDDEQWLVASIKVPEVEFTQDTLARIEAGLATAVSNTHFATPDKNDGHATRIRGKAISLVNEAEVPGARILNITRHAGAG